MLMLAPVVVNNPTPARRIILSNGLELNYSDSGNLVNKLHPLVQDFVGVFDWGNQAVVQLIKQICSFRTFCKDN